MIAQCQQQYDAAGLDPVIRQKNADLICGTMTKIAGQQQIRAAFFDDNALTDDQGKEIFKKHEYGYDETIFEKVLSILLHDTSKQPFADLTDALLTHQMYPQISVLSKTAVYFDYNEKQPSPADHVKSAYIICSSLKPFQPSAIKRFFVIRIYVILFLTVQTKLLTRHLNLVLFRSIFNRVYLLKWWDTFCHLSPKLN